MLDRFKKFLCILLTLAILCIPVPLMAQNETTVNVSFTDVTPAPTIGSISVDTEQSHVNISNGGSVAPGTYNIEVYASDATNQYALIKENVALVAGSNSISFAQADMAKITLSLDNTNNTAFTPNRIKLQSAGGGFCDIKGNNLSNVYISKTTYQFGAVSVGNGSYVYCYTLPGFNGKSSIDNDISVNMDLNFTSYFESNPLTCLQYGNFVDLSGGKLFIQDGKGNFIIGAGAKIQDPQSKTGLAAGEGKLVLTDVNNSSNTYTGIIDDFGLQGKVEAGFANPLEPGTYSATFSLNDTNSSPIPIAQAATQLTLKNLMDIKFDNGGSYVEFNTGNNNYTNVNDVEFRLNGDFTPNTITGDGSDLIKGFDVTLNEVVGGNPVNSPIVLSNIWANASNNSMDKTRLDVQLGVNPGAISANKTYRISFQDSMTTAILSGIANNVTAVPSGSMDAELQLAFSDKDKNSYNLVDDIQGQFAGSASTLKQLASVSNGDANKVYIIGPTLKYKFDFSSSFSDVAKVGFVIEGTEADNKIVNGTLSGQSFSEHNDVTGKISASTSGGINTYSVLMDVASQNITSGSADMVFKDAQAAEFSLLMQKYVWGRVDDRNEDDTLKQKGSVFAVAYDSQNKLIGWSKINNLDNSILYTSPTLSIGSSGAQPDIQINAFKGYYQGDDKAPHPEIRLDYLGQGGAKVVAVKGITTCGSKTYPFVLVLNGNGDPGNFSNNNIQFTDSSDSNIKTSLPSGWGTQKDFWASLIPVNF